MCRNLLSLQTDAEAKNQQCIDIDKLYGESSVSVHWLKQELETLRAAHTSVLGEMKCSHDESKEQLSNNLQELQNQFESQKMLHVEMVSNN